MQISDNLYCIRTKCYSMINYVYLEIDEYTKKAVLVDPSWNLEELLYYISYLKLDLSAVLLTHSHFDHTNLAERIAVQTGASVYMSRVEAESYHFNCKNLITVEDGDIISVGEKDIKCLLTPGHTRGGMCFLTDKSFYSGDTVFLEGCGFCPDHKSAGEMYDSFQKILKTTDKNLYVYPGHYYVKVQHMTLKDVLDYNIYFQFRTREEFIQFRMREGQKDLLKFI